MLHLYVIRHADAVPREDPTYADDDRPLTELGKRQSRALGETLSEQGVQFDVILCSPLPRAQETVEGILAGLSGKPPVEYTADLRPGFKSRKLDREVAKHGGKAVALVGHEPDLSAVRRPADRLEKGERNAGKSRIGLRGVRGAAEQGMRFAPVADPAGVVHVRRLTATRSRWSALEFSPLSALRERGGG